MAIMLCGAMFLLGGLGARWGASMAPKGTIESLAWSMPFSIIAQVPIVFAYSSLRKRCGSRHIAKVSLIAFIVFVPMALAVAGILHGIFVLIGYEPSTILGHETLELLKSSPWTKQAWIVVICATIGAGIFEEVLYRGLILPTFAAVIGGKTAWGAIIATSILFTLMHASAVPTSAMAGLFILSIGLCWARVKSGGVLAPILIHIVFNAMNISIVYSTTL
jgi:membrane protease YdiL (CAAX protease family)